ncbi:MAG: ribosome maturation factor RimM [Eubacterium sp.]|nr:ribosome maturation factor RimM [Eubacterium sp.]
MKEIKVPDDLYQVGAIIKTHGLRGEVKVFPLTDDVSRFDGMKDLILIYKNERISLEVASARPQKNLVILKFKGYDNINDVEKYLRCGLFVTKDNRVELEDNEYFIADLIGCECFTDEGEDLGEITDVITTGANDVYVVTPPDGKEILIPAIRQCVLNVDVDGGRVEVKLMKGLRE